MAAVSVVRVLLSLSASHQSVHSLVEVCVSYTHVLLDILLKCRPLTILYIHSPACFDGLWFACLVGGLAARLTVWLLGWWFGYTVYGLAAWLTTFLNIITISNCLTSTINNSFILQLLPNIYNLLKPLWFDYYCLAFIFLTELINYLLI